MNFKERVSNSFNFTYAGSVNIFISMTRKNFCVACRGFEEVDGIVFFDYTKKWRKNYKTLYEAVSEFNYQVNKVVQSMDWFTMSFFENDEEFKRSCLKEFL